MRNHSGLPKRKIGLDYQVIISQTPKLHVALLADRVYGVFEIDGQEIIIRADRVLPKAEYVESVVKLTSVSFLSRPHPVLLKHCGQAFLGIGPRKTGKRSVRRSEESIPG
jgi:hypothetical protein